MRRGLAMNELSDPTTIVIERQNAPVPEAEEEVLVAEEVLVEEVSIDGMCGVY
jgi:mycofactocin precursor